VWEVTGLIAAVLNRGEGDLNGEPLLRIHDLDATRRNAQSERWKATNIVDERACRSIGFISGPSVIAMKGLMIPPVRRGFGKGMLSL
jgi:hypothetical protein